MAFGETQSLPIVLLAAPKGLRLTRAFKIFEERVWSGEYGLGLFSGCSVWEYLCPELREAQQEMMNNQMMLKPCQLEC